MNSAKYWQDRYAKGGDSGAGSKNHLAEFKTKTVAQLLQKYKCQSVTELGCGDGMQLETLYPTLTELGIRYTGFDISYLVVMKLRQKFGDNFGSMSYLDSDEGKQFKGDAALSLDVIYHLVEDEVFNEYMRKLFHHGRKCVIIYSSDHEDNEGSAEWVRHRLFSKWVKENAPAFKYVEYIPNPWPWKKGMPPRKSRNTSVSNFHVYVRKN